MKIDINSDMGEGFGVYSVCDDEQMMETVSSANIACGFHAGDPFTMTKMLRMAKKNSVAVGAHPGLPDRLGFGRKEINFSNEELCQIVIYQIGALNALANLEGLILSHVSFHAALGSMINRDSELADQVMETISKLLPNVAICSLPDTVIQKSALKFGLKSIILFLADRAYSGDGSLVPRGVPGSLITDEANLRSRVRQFLLERTVTTMDGAVIAIKASSILVHSDTPGAEQLAKIIKGEIELLGAQVTSLSELI
ncbi:LamB/YcsF family protein [Vibrio sp.]|nr:LamB/YcsF family protein [Vibrio sp.]